MIHSLIILFANFLLSHHPLDSTQLHTIKGMAQGTTYSITYIAPDSILHKTEVEKLLNAIDSSLSLYKDYSLIHQFNASKRSIKMDEHLCRVVQKATEISSATNGNFDITCKPIINLWNNSQKTSTIPSSEKINQTLKHVGFRHLFIIGDSLIKDHPSVQIDCDGIAQGYTVDQLSLLLKKKNIENFIIELGGEIYANGQPLDKPYWKVAIQPTENPLHQTEIQVALKNKAITTSGSMSKFKKIGKDYFSHVVDPKNGRPVNHQIVAVSVLASDAMTADALDNAFMVMGIESALEWVKRNPTVGVCIYYLDDIGYVQKILDANFGKVVLH